MLFNSFEFLIFLPTVFLLHWFVFKPLKWQNLFIVVVSYIFYGWWDWRFLLLIAFTTAYSFYSGLAIEKHANHKKRRKWLCASSIIVNLLILGVFKYYNFFKENMELLFHTFGIQLDWVTLDILLPVGISFYTFQALSYTIDVYKKKLEPTHDIVAFFAFISFFPQLVAGPIERATNLLPQFCKSRRFDYIQSVDGLRQILWGLFKKMVVADNQIYGDFSGYTDVANGTARLFGISLMRNFNFPYFSRDIAEFWRKWHISLTTWFRDYIYIPLGGSRKGKWKSIRNTFIIFLVSGLWHGANWTFITWGLFHAVLFLPLLLGGKNRKHLNTVAQGKYLPSQKELGQMGLTFLFVVIGWIIFRAETVGDALDYICRIVTHWKWTLPDIHRKAALATAILLCVEWSQREKQHGLQLSGNGLLKFRIVRWSYYIALILLIIHLSGIQADFIYFQF